jgi:sec-independent protein translocase protein TatB
MIDLGLSKLAIIGVVALIVIGPEKLPKVARMAGTLYGRAQRYLHEVKSEVSREIELDELRNLQKEVQDTAQSIKENVENTIAQESSTMSTPPGAAIPPPTGPRCPTSNARRAISAARS